MARLGVTASMTTKTVAIVQARMGSSRFPGKMLAQLGGIPLLEWVLRRLARATALDQIVLATSDNENDNPLADLAIKLGVQVYRGSESDVLARFIGAATMTNATNVVRICADNPFIDPEEVNRLITYFAEHQCDYACNHQDRLGSGYADGFGAEIFSADILKTIATLAKEPRHREHATLYLWDHPKEFKLAAIRAPAELSFPELRFDVDTPEDLQKMQKWVEAGVTIDSTAPHIIGLARSIDRLASGNSNGVSNA
jgi:spore coat polysaccharide biosynthesis protein SpsF